MNTDDNQTDNKQQTDDNQSQEGKGRILTDEEAAMWGEPDFEIKSRADSDDKDEADTSDETDAEDVNEEDIEDETEDVDTGDLFTPTLEDPGEYKPQDYSFDVVTYDAEGNNPKIHKVKTLEDAERLLEADPSFGSAKNLLDFNRKVSRMENKSEQDKAEWQKSKDAYDVEAKILEEQHQQTMRVVNGFEYLTKKGKIPPISPKYLNANWDKPEVAKQPGVRERIALATYMKTENRTRAAAGIELLTGAVDTYNAMMQDGKFLEAKKTNKQAADQRKQAGARVAGTSTTTNRGAAPKGVSVGVGGSLRDLDSNDWK